MKTDTIAAIATALSDAGIGIVRISGPEAISIADRIFCNSRGKKTLSLKASHTVSYGYIMDKGSILDEVMVVLLKAPHSYTTEDTVEINCHGGILLLQKVLQLVLCAGARLAEPGEFTRRAFLNGRIDLSQAEAVMDVIHSQSELALSASMNQLTGKLTSVIRDLREQILYEIAFIESALDDPEHISLDDYEKRLTEKCGLFMQRIDGLIASANDGKIISQGIKTVIVGRPNAGKSSLLNAIMGEERAIVTQVPGTTRDVLQESVSLDGILLHIVDTAGIRHTEDIVEQIGVDKAKEYAERADLILFVIDGSEPPDQREKEIISLIGQKPVIVIVNKADLTTIVSDEQIHSFFPDREDLKIARISASEGTGISQLKKLIQLLFFQGTVKEDSETVITNIRHTEALREARYSLSMVEQGLQKHMSEDFYSIDLMGAYVSLGHILGEEVGDDLVQEIFSKFCMGK